MWVLPEATDTDGLELGSGVFVTQVSPAMTGPGWRGQVEAVALDFVRRQHTSRASFRDGETGRAREPQSGWLPTCSYFLVAATDAIFF